MALGLSRLVWVGRVRLVVLGWWRWVGHVWLVGRVEFVTFIWFGGVGLVVLGW